MLHYTAQQGGAVIGMIAKKTPHICAVFADKIVILSEFDRPNKSLDLMPTAVHETVNRICAV